jgi:hypothetical protein
MDRTEFRKLYLVYLVERPQKNLNMLKHLISFLILI